MSLAVVGTDTGVGKTVICSLLLARYSRPGLAYWKPVATGAERDRDTQFIRGRVGGRAEVLEEEYRFTPPVSPHLAARLAGVDIDLDRLLAAWQAHTAGGREIVVEGIGGVLVPLNDRGDLLADLIAKLGIPAVLVARTALGTINHTLLSLEAMRARGIGIAGVVLDGPPSPENLEAIERFGKIQVVSEVPVLIGGNHPSTSAILNGAAAFDPRGVLGRHLRGPVTRHGDR